MQIIQSLKFFAYISLLPRQCPEYSLDLYSSTGCLTCKYSWPKDLNKGNIAYNKHMSLFYCQLHITFITKIFSVFFIMRTMLNSVILIDIVYCTNYSNIGIFSLCIPLAASVPWILLRFELFNRLSQKKVFTIQGYYLLQFTSFEDPRVTSGKQDNHPL